MIMRPVCYHCGRPGDLRVDETGVAWHCWQCGIYKYITVEESLQFKQAEAYLSPFDASHILGKFNRQGRVRRVTREEL